MKLTFQKLDHAVLQRDDRDFCCTAIYFTEAAPGSRITLEVISGNKKIKAGTSVSADEKGNGVITPDLLKTGGPYDLVLQDESGESVTICDVLVGDVYILAGQSNMSGAGKLSEKSPSSPHVRAFTPENFWEIAADPVHRKKSSYQPSADPRCNEQFLAVGPGLAFACELERLTAVPQGLIPGAVGGSCLAEWEPDRKATSETEQELPDYYSALRKRFQLSGAGARGLFWFQGEADTRDERYNSYSTKTRILFEAFRRDFALNNMDFPIVMAQLATLCNNSRPIGWPSVREQQRRFQNWEEKIAVIPTLDLDVLDGLHLSAGSAQETGRRGAKVMYGLLCNDKTVLHPQVDEIVSSWDPEIKAPSVIVSFKDLHGDLKAEGKAWGFLIHDKKTLLPLPVLSFTELSGNRAIVHLSRSEYGVDVSERYLISFGGECHAHINITDGEGRIPLGFGPLPIRDGKDDPSVKK